MRRTRAFATVAVAVALSVTTALPALVGASDPPEPEGEIRQLSSTAGFANGDTDPAHTALANLGYTRSVGIDYQRRSVGADLVAPQHVRRVELVATTATSRITGDDYTLWVSDDNQTYERVDGWTFDASVSGASLVHTFDDLDVTARYIKINTTFEDDAFTFLIGDFQRDVRIFGFAPDQPGQGDPVDIGDGLELLVDEHLVGELTGDAEQQIHAPQRREVVMTADQPWEGSASHYRAVFQDGDIYRMYYLGLDYDVTADGLTQSPFRPLLYAESDDGIHWERPNLGRVEFDGSTDNNILLEPGSFEDHGIVNMRFASVFKDTNPDATVPYKAIANAQDGVGGTWSLFALGSSNGLDWEPLSDEPVMQSGAGGITPHSLDSQNLAFWDGVRGEYRAYFRDWNGPVRSIKTATSPDFVNWTVGPWLEYPDASPGTQLYTQPIVPYERAPQLFVGFPMRYQERDRGPSYDALPNLEHREWRSAVSPRYGTAVTDALFMSSRDGVTFTRSDEAVIRPGLGTDNWKYGDNSVAHGILTTPSAVEGAPDELSVYATEGYWTSPDLDVVRYTWRLDGFGSVHAGADGGTFTTTPLLFTGDELVLNYATSAAGSIRVEVLDADGVPLPGRSLADSDEIYGDSIERVASWNGETGLGDLAGQPVRFRFVLADADIYSLQVRRHCDTTVTGEHAGALAVSEGTTCLDAAAITGPVTVEPEASLVSTDSDLRGRLTAAGAASIVVCGSSVKGPIGLTDGAAVTLGDPATGCAPNTVAGPVRVVGTDGPVTVAGNTIDGPLICLRNDPAPTNAGQPNTVTGPTSGQCSGL